MSSRFWLFLCLIFAVPARADTQISALTGLSTVELSGPECGKLNLGYRYPVVSSGVQGREGEFLGYVRILEFAATTAKAEVLSRADNRLIRVGDKILIIDLIDPPPANFPGRAEAQISARYGIAARYKPLVYVASNTHTAETLNQGEMLLNILGDVGYGLTHSLSLATNSLLWIVGGVPNAGVKTMFLDNSFVTLAAGGNYFYYPSQQLHSGGLGLFARLNGTGRFISHYSFVFNFSSVGGLTRLSESTGPFGLYFNSRFQSQYEVILDNWHRLILGPTFEVDTRAIGGYFGFLWVGRYMHFGVGLRSANILNFSFSSTGYVPDIQIYARF